MELTGGSDLNAVDLGARDLGPKVVCERIEFASWELDAFLEELDGCSHYEGYIVLDGPVASLSALKALRVIEGGFSMFHNHWVSTLEGLERLEKVGSLSIIGGVLESLSALGRLREVKYLRLQETRLTDLRGLEGLETVTAGPLNISSNPDLRDLRALKALRRVNGDVRIQTNPLLPLEEVEWLLGRIEVSGSVVVN